MMEWDIVRCDQFVCVPMIRYDGRYFDVQFFCHFPCPVAVAMNASMVVEACRSESIHPSSSANPEAVKPIYVFNANVSFAELLRTMFLELGLEPLSLEEQSNEWRNSVDLIMEDKEYIVFVEVRFRGSQRYGGALASIGRQKITRLRKTAQHFLQRFDPAGRRPCRFDLLVPDSIDEPEWTWIRNAF